MELTREVGGTLRVFLGVSGEASEFCGSVIG